MSEIIKQLNFLKTQKWVDLTHAVTNQIPYFPSFSPIEEETLFTVDKDGFFAKKYKLVTQYGTHIDAPIHFANDTRFLEELALKELVLPLFVIHKEKEVAENNDYTVSIQDILDFEEENGLIPSESFVAFSSNWSKRFSKPEEFYNKDESGISHTPGWSIEALKFLHEERNVLAIGHETLDTDSGVDCAKNEGLIGELYWLSQNKYQVEVLTNLDKVPATGAAIFIGFPKIADAPGFNARVFAICPN